MIVSFIRSGDRRVQILVERDDGALLEVRPYDAPHTIPHDLAHFVVEQEMGLREGFWGRIARGGLFESVTILRPASRRVPARTRKAHGPSEVHEAEVLVGILVDIWTGVAERDFGSVRAYVDSCHAPRTRSRSEELDANVIERVCAALDVAAKDWTELPLSGRLSLRWASTLPRRAPSSRSSRPRALAGRR